MSYILTFLLSVSAFAVDKTNFFIVGLNEKEKNVLSYTDGVKKAKLENKPLILFVGVKPIEIEDFVICYESKPIKGVDLEKGYTVCWFKDKILLGDVVKEEFDELKVYSILKNRGVDIPIKLKSKFSTKTELSYNTPSLLNPICVGFA